MRPKVSQMTKRFGMLVHNDKIRSVVALCFILAFFSVAPGAKADTISFNSNTTSDSSWTLTSPLVFQLSSALTSVQLNSAAPNTAIQYGAIDWSTFSGLALSQTAILFNPGGAIKVTGDLGSGVVDLFTGNFQSAGLTLLTGGAPDQATFSASFIAGDINPALYAFLGSSGLPADVTGTLTATLDGAFTASGGGVGTVAGASISLDPSSAQSVSEPPSLALFGTGLFALAGLVAIKKRPLLIQ
jgi:hypothetical protein